MFISTCHWQKCVPPNLANYSASSIGTAERNLAIVMKGAFLPEPALSVAGDRDRTSSDEPKPEEVWNIQGSVVLPFSLIYSPSASP